MRTRKPSTPHNVICSVCGNSFMSSHSQAKYCSDGCRETVLKKYHRDYRDEHRERFRSYSRDNYNRNSDAIIKRTQVYSKTPIGKKVVRKSYLNQIERHPQRVKARQAVLIAIRQGILVRKPCEKCGNKRVHAHHQDYSKPLAVIWLCSKCHYSEHKRIKESAIKELE